MARLDEEIAGYSVLRLEPNGVAYLRNAMTVPAFPQPWRVSVARGSPPCSSTKNGVRRRRAPGANDDLGSYFNQAWIQASLSPRWPRAETRLKPESILVETDRHHTSLLTELLQPKCISQGKAQFNGLQGKCLESQ